MKGSAAVVVVAFAAVAEVGDDEDDVGVADDDDSLGHSQLGSELLPYSWVCQDLNMEVDHSSIFENNNWVKRIHNISS